MTHPARELLDGFSALGAIDVTCHLGQWPFRLDAAADPARLRAYAARYGLTAIWVSHLAALFGFDTRTGNEACLASSDGVLLRPFAVLNPNEPGWERELEWTSEAGFAGVRIAPGIHGYPAASATELIAACAASQLPVQLLVRLDDARVRHPRWPATDPTPQEIADLLRTATDLVRAAACPLVISGFNWAQWNELNRHLADQTPATTRLDLWHLNGPSQIADELAREPTRWLFGSGYPVQSPEPTILQLAASHLTPADLGAITHANACSISREPWR